MAQVMEGKALGQVVHLELSFDAPLRRVASALIPLFMRETTLLTLL